jgi:excisionase family DNA binding protein
MADTPKPIAYRLTTVCRLLNLHRNTVRQWISDGKLEASRPTKRTTLVTAASVHRLITPTT